MDWTPFLNISTFALTQVFMLVGLLGLLVPAFPGILVMWLAALLYGLVTGFETLGIVLFVIITVLMIAGEVADNVLMGAGARKAGAAWVASVLSRPPVVAGVISFTHARAQVQQADQLTLTDQRYGQADAGILEAAQGG